MHESEVNVGECLQECRQSLTGQPRSVQAYGERLLSVVEAALADPSGEDRNQAIRYLELLQEHLDRNLAGYKADGSDIEPPAIRAIGELRRRVQHDDVRHQRTTRAIALTTLGVSVVGATFGALAYFAPKQADAPPAAPPAGQIAPAPAPALPVQPPPASPPG